MSVVAVQCFRDSVYALSSPTSIPAITIMVMAIMSAIVGRRDKHRDARPAISIIGRHNHAGSQAAEQGNGKCGAQNLFHGISSNNNPYFY